MFNSREPTDSSANKSTSWIPEIIKILAEWEDVNGVLAAITPDEWLTLLPLITKAAVSESPRQIRQIMLRSLEERADSNLKASLLHFETMATTVFEKLAELQTAIKKEATFEVTRDYFAATAPLMPDKILSIRRHDRMNSPFVPSPTDMELRTRWAYEWANAMMKTRAELNDNTKEDIL